MVNSLGAWSSPGKWRLFSWQETLNMWRHCLVCSGELPVQPTCCDISSRPQLFSWDFGAPGRCPRAALLLGSAVKHGNRFREGCESLHEHFHQSNHKKKYLSFEIGPASPILLALGLLGVLVFTSTWGMTQPNFRATLLSFQSVGWAKLPPGRGNGKHNPKKDWGLNKKYMRKKKKGCDWRSQRNKTSSPEYIFHWNVISENCAESCTFRTQQCIKLKFLITIVYIRVVITKM